MSVILQGDALTILSGLPSESVNCCVTSPPYWGLRDYGTPGQIGQEATPAEFVARLVAVFEQVRRVLKKDGTCWVNLGDSYASVGKWGGSSGGKNQASKDSGAYIRQPKEWGDLKSKDLVGIPWRVAFGLQDAGWYLRSDIIWSKPNPMPESVTDRPTKAHEYVFLLTKSEKYWYDAKAIREPSTTTDPAKLAFGERPEIGLPDGRMPDRRRAKVPGGWDTGPGGHGTVHRTGRTSAEYQEAEVKEGRNKRTVWTIATQPYPEAHFATFPEELPRLCILAGCPVGGVVLDPFLGSGTTLAVASALGRDGIGIELNAEYIALAEKRIAGVTPGFRF